MLLVGAARDAWALAAVGVVVVAVVALACAGFTVVAPNEPKV